MSEVYWLIVATETRVYQFQEAFKHIEDGNIDGIELWTSSFVVSSSRTKQLFDQRRLDVVFCCRSCCWRNNDNEIIRTKAYVASAPCTTFTNTLLFIHTTKFNSRTISYQEKCALSPFQRLPFLPSSSSTFCCISCRLTSTMHTLIRLRGRK